MSIKQKALIIMSSFIFAISITHATFSRGLDFWVTDGLCGVNLSATLNASTTTGKLARSMIDQVYKDHKNGGNINRTAQKYKNKGAGVEVPDGTIYSKSFYCWCPEGKTCGVK